jgi:carbamoyl-phosphate synthase large subunit
MAKILVMGAGSAQSNGVINSLLDVDNPEEIIGAGSEPTDLIFCRAEKKYLLPHSLNKDYKSKLLALLNKEKPDFIHFQHDQELIVASSFRNEIISTGTKLFIPDHEDIDTCVYKYKSYLKFKEAGLKVPKNIVINNENDLKSSFEQLTTKNEKIWLRQMSIGGGGKGSVATDSFNFAKEWINHNNGWEDFIAAEVLTPNSATFASIWYEGELIVGQGRQRKGWSGRSVSGVTGVTKVGMISNNNHIVDIAIESIKAVSKRPHGIFGVDMTYDFDNILNPTEINIGRFFTTIEFFKQAGLNMPEILKDIAIYNKFPKITNKINPLKNENLMWLRAMDEKPLLISKQQLENSVISL